MKRIGKASIIIILIFSFKMASAQTLEAVADSIRVKNGIPEMSFAVVTKDSILIIRTIGYHKMTELNEEPTARMEDLFHIGSNTKSITGFIAASLVDKGKIKWNTKLFDLFPTLKAKSNKVYHNVTLEDLLSHRAKIQAFIWESEFQKLPELKGNKQEKRAQFAKYVLTLPPVESDKSYNYSNAGYSVATMMLEKVSGKSWETLVNEVLNITLKLDVAFGWPSRNRENQPYGHWEEGGKQDMMLPTNSYSLSLVEPGGDLSMSIEGYARFMKLNIEGLAGHNNLLKSDTYKYIHRFREDYAIGWGNYEKEGLQLSAHGGSDGTFNSFAQIDRKNLIGYIVLANSGTEKAEKGVYEMLDILKEKYGK